ncbi:WecB/TagA/CpsF family glycosyltransferase [Flavobacteriaceae bacterium TP-CH-4]|uniref:WecB/TagA/CpsF family glycosyltransferase n=1 Tax=Pelagihabitans pacificus TaxID=2696054 RepID=A0A967B1I0_9FLAO|nr:WecB/TagA/CpsF family glycosyltransferase [Pelagihabitans pacificus]NHF61392.1 WecB/TagA/CpsF family glycosyltransferase [Pelagihabitans pacificus]
MQNTTEKILGYRIFTNDLSHLPTNQKVIVNTLNQYSYCIAERDSRFKKALLDSDVLLPDGIGVVLAAKFLNGKRVQKVAGADLHRFLLQKLDSEKGKCFYLGATDSTLDKIRNRIMKDYPNVEVASYSPPFKPSFSREDNESMLRQVNAFQPDVLFIGMTAPKQEKWSAAHKEAIQAGMICSVGAVFDFYAGTVKRPNKIWIDSGLEWLGRLVKEPKRMWKRYIYYGAVFLYYLVREKWSTSAQQMSK